MVALFGSIIAAGCYHGLDAADPDASATGSDADDDDDGTDGTATSEGDDAATEDVELGVSDLRHLTRFELRNAITDLFGEPLAADVDAELSAVPNEVVEHGFSTMDRGMTSPHVDAYFATAVAVARRVSADPDLRASLSPCLQAPSDEAECALEFVAEFGMLAYRRPLSDAERDDILLAFADKNASTFEQRLENALLYILLSPQFLYRVELDGTPTEQANVYTLTPHELASRISYLVWAGAPDRALLAAADAGELDDDDGIATQLERMWADPRAKRGVVRFFVEWLELDSRPGLNFSPGFLGGLPTEGLLDDMAGEIERVVEHEVFTARGSYGDLLTTRVAFVASPGLAAIYEVSPGIAGMPIALDDARAGVLTRAAMLLGPGDETHPILRGAFIQRRLLCNELKVPPANDFPPGTFDPPAFDPAKTNRERWDEKTSAPACAACHTMINPFGFAAEGFDAIGRARLTEPIIDPAGDVVNTLPVDTAVAPMLDGEPHPVADLGELSAAIADSEQGAVCFANQWVRYAQGRLAAPDDGAMVAALREAATAADGGLRGLISAYSARPEFRLVRWADGE